MKAVNRRLFKRFASEQIKGEVEAELRFHLQLLTEALLQQAISPEEANAASSASNPACPCFWDFSPSTAH
jgi:hypothetical protein